jgi:hypothetical protein
MSVQHPRIPPICSAVKARRPNITLNYRLKFTPEKPVLPGEDKIPTGEDGIPTLIATPANGAVTLNWTPVSGATGYNIWMGTNAGDNNGSVAKIAAHEHWNMVAAGVRHTSYVHNNPPLMNGWEYSYVVSASGKWGIGEDSNEASATPAARPELVSAALRKTHGTVDYDIPITGLKPGTLPVECRSGSTLKLVATFNKPISSGVATVAEGKARLNGKPTFAGNTMTINLYDVSVEQRLEIDLTGVTATDGTQLNTDMAPKPKLEILILAGDVDRNGEVNSKDTDEWRVASGTFAGSPGFEPRADITGNGAVDLADAIRIRENYNKKVP